MSRFIAGCILSMAIVLMPRIVIGQAFGEYGRAVGSIPRGPSAPGGLGGSVPGTGADRNVGDLGGRALPARLIVVAKDVGLFPRQDDETERTAHLTQGQKLIPLVQSEGRNHWYMVRTETGLIGWVKSNDVKPEPKATN